MFLALLPDAVAMTCRNADIRRWQRLSVTQLPSYPWSSEGIGPSISGAQTFWRSWQVRAALTPGFRDEPTR